MLENLAQRVNSNAWLVHRGRYLSTVFLVEAAPEISLVRIHAGRIESVQNGPLVMPRWTFALRATADTWSRFWQPNPQPGFHDLIAMLKFRTLKIEGDQYPFMSNLLYFKEVMASLRMSAP
jgi:hypothetical protein